MPRTTRPYPTSSGGGTNLSDLFGGALSGIRSAWNSTGRPGANSAYQTHTGSPWPGAPRPRPRPVQGPRLIQGPGLGHHAGEKKFTPRRSSSTSSTRSGGSTGRSTSGSSRVRSRGVSGGSQGTSATGGGSNQRIVRRGRPKTYRGPDGSIRQTSAAFRSGKASAGGRRGAAGPVEDPISKIVDDIIAGMNQPLDEQARKLREQSIGNINQTNRLHDFYDAETGKIADEANVDFGSMLARAAELKGISADTIAKHQDYLQSLVGAGNGGTMEQQIGDAASATQSEVAAVNDAFAKDLAAEGQSLSGVMGQLRASGRAAQREINQQELLARSAGEREIEAAKAANTAQRAQLMRQIQNEERDAALKQQVAEAEWGLKTAQAQSLDNYRQGQLGLQAARLQQQANGSSKPAKRGRYGNVDPKFDSSIDKVYANVSKRYASGDLTAPWRTSQSALKDMGLDPTAAAFISTRWWADHARKESSPLAMRRHLVAAGVSPAAHRRIIDQIFGAGSYGRVANGTGLGGAFNQLGNIIGNATRR